MGKAIVSRNAYHGGMRPFLRLINEAAKAFGNLDILTIERAEPLNKRMTELCDEFYNRRSSFKGAQLNTDGARV